MGRDSKMENQGFRVKKDWSASEIGGRNEFLKLFKACPIPEGELLSNLGLFIRRQDLTHILFMDDLYRKILSVHGIVVEFGVR
jgi:hypothetical protein